MTPRAVGLNRRSRYFEYSACDIAAISAAENSRCSELVSNGPAGGKVALSGTRVSDSAQVTGIFDFLTGELTLNATGAAGAIEEIEALGPEPLVG